jgi:hypothetical protein
LQRKLETEPDDVQIDNSSRPFRLLVGQVTTSYLLTPPLVTILASMQSEQQSSHKSSHFKILPDGNHEHHLTHKGAELGTTESLVNFTKLVWKSMQVQETECVSILMDPERNIR